MPSSSETSSSFPPFSSAADVLAIGVGTDIVDFSFVSSAELAVVVGATVDAVATSWVWSVASVAQAAERRPNSKVSAVAGRWSRIMGEDDRTRW